MAPIVADMSVSLDGFVADLHDDVTGVFTWYAKPQPSQDEAEGSEALKTAVGMRTDLGVILYGRRTFELANGWGGRHPTGAPVIVVSHSVADGWPRPDGQVRFAGSVDEALEMADVVAADKTVAVGAPSLVGQLLDKGLLDGVRLSVVPILLGRGISYFGDFDATSIELDGPVVQVGNGVTHLAYAVRR